MNSPAADSAVTQEPIGIAVVGAGPQAIFHLESAAVRSGYRPIAAATTDSSQTNGDAIPQCPFVSLDRVLGDDDVKLVFVTGGPDDVLEPGMQVLSAGRHLVVDPLASLSLPTLQQLSDHAAEQGRCCTVWRPQTSDENWRQALKVTRSSESGPVRSVRFLLHELAVSMLPSAIDSRMSRPYAELTNGVLRTFGPHCVSQLLELVESPVSSVFGQLHGRRLKFGSTESSCADVAAVDTGFVTTVTFESGVTAMLEMNLCCAAPLATGWVVQFAGGGFADGRHSITVADGEVYQVPVAAEPVDPYDQLAASISAWHDAAVQAQSRKTLARETVVARIIELIRQSHESRQVVEFDA